VDGDLALVTPQISIAREALSIIIYALRSAVSSSDIMGARFRSEIEELNAETDKVHQEHRNRKRALLAETREKEDALRDWHDDQLRRIERKRNNLILQVTSANHTSVRPSGTVLPEPEAVTSSSPVNTEHLLEDEPHASPHVLQADRSGMSAMPDNQQEAAESRQSPHSHSASGPDVAVAGSIATVAPTNGHHLVQHAQQATSPSVLHAIPVKSGVVSTALQDPAEATDQPSSQIAPAVIEIDISHVIPVAEQTDPGVTTYMICRPRTKRGEFHSLHVLQNRKLVLSIPALASLLGSVS